MTDPSELIAKLEAAKEPSRKLDAEIAGHRVGAKLLKYEKIGSLNESFVFAGPNPCPVRQYTSSLDAAMTLIDGKFWRLAFFDGRYSAEVENNGFVYAPTPALALCIAALKARVE